MITVSYNAYCAISKEGDNDIWTVRPRGVVPLLPLCSQIYVRATVNALLGDTFSRENNTHGSRFHDRDPQFASQILGAMTHSCYIGTRDIRSRVIRSPYCTCHWHRLLTSGEINTLATAYKACSGQGKNQSMLALFTMPATQDNIPLVKKGAQQSLNLSMWRHSLNQWTSRFPRNIIWTIVPQFVHAY